MPSLPPPTEQPTERARALLAEQYEITARGHDKHDLPSAAAHCRAKAAAIRKGHSELHALRAIDVALSRTEIKSVDAHLAALRQAHSAPALEDCGNLGWCRLPGWCSRHNEDQVAPVVEGAVKEALHNLIVLARPHFSDATQMLALEQAEAALSALSAPASAGQEVAPLPNDRELVERLEEAANRIHPGLRSPDEFLLREAASRITELSCPPSTNTDDDEAFHERCLNRIEDEERANTDGDQKC